MIKLLKSHPFFSDKTIDSCTLLEHQGYCNENYLVLAEGTKYIVRRLLRTDIDRKLEYNVQNLAFEKGITAELLVLDEENALMVFAFLDGEHKSKLDENDLKQLAVILRILHSIEIDAKPIEIDIENKSDEVVKAFEIINKYPKEHVPCHNDLNSQNIFFSDEIKLIDLEYAGVNDKYFDLACVCVEFELDEKEEDVLLKNYFNNENIQNDKLEAYKTIYKALCAQWFEMLETTLQ